MGAAQALRRAMAGTDAGMWRCGPCGATGEAHFEVCWRCGAPRTDVEGAARPPHAGGDPKGEGPGGGDAHWAADTFVAADAPEPHGGPSPKTCPACGGELDYRGEMPIRVGGPDGLTLFRGLAELGARLWKVHPWACCDCRRLEFYEGE